MFLLSRFVMFFRRCRASALRRCLIVLSAGSLTVVSCNSNTDGQQQAQTGHESLENEMVEAMKGNKNIASENDTIIAPVVYTPDPITPTLYGVQPVYVPDPQPTTDYGVKPVYSPDTKVTLYGVETPENL